MSLKALDELRGMIDKSRHEYEQGNVSYVVGFNDIADAIEAEIAERYMELPVGADGLPIHVGDKMEYIDCAPFMVCAVAPGVIHAWAETKLGEGKTTEAYPPVQCHHFKPRTIEDVLGEFAKRVLNSGHQWGLDAEETTAEYAAELRELMGGGE